MMELAESDELYDRPLHPYTKALLSAIPIPDPELEKKEKRLGYRGEVPSPGLMSPQGCRFCNRCPLAADVCFKEEPEFNEIEKGHYVACHMVKRR